MNLNSDRAKKYFDKHPIIEIYRGYEIRDDKGLFIVDASIGIYSTTSNYIEGCYKFIDELADRNIKQYDGEAVMRYLIERDKQKHRI
jgi:hypothetical protein